MIFTCCLRLPFRMPTADKATSSNKDTAFSKILPIYYGQDVQHYRIISHILVVSVRLRIVTLCSLKSSKLPSIQHRVDLSQYFRLIFFITFPKILRDVTMLPQGHITNLHLQLILISSSPINLS